MARGANPTRRVDAGFGHVYFLDGEKLTGRGVTTIIGNGLPKPSLQYWAAREVATAAVQKRDVWEPVLQSSGERAAIELLKEEPFANRDAAARRGTEVHRLAEKLHAGEEIDVPEELQGHVDQYLDWWETWWPEDCIVEGVVVNRTHRYCGTFDLIATFDGWHGDGKPARVLVDLKTSRSGIYPEIGMQLAAYRNAETYLPDPSGGEELPMPEVDAVAALHVTADQWSFLAIGDSVEVGGQWRDAFRAFLYVDQVAQFLGTSKSPGWGASLVGAPRLKPNPKF